MSSNILFLIPPRVYGVGEYGKVHPALGALYLCSILKGDGHNVHFIDTFAEDIHNRSYFDGKREFVGLSFDDIIRRVKKFNPKYLLISNLFTNFAHGTEKLIQLLKKDFPEIPIIMGGPHATLMKKQLMNENPEIDFLICGEGEFSIRNLIRVLETGSNNFSEIAGLIYRDNNEIIMNPVSFIEDLNSIPFPLRELLPKNSYDQHSVMSPILKSAEIITSRGCPWSCGFCSTSRIWGKIYRTRSVENIIAEIELLEKAGINHLYISDDSFNTDKERTRAICHELKKKKILWACHQGMILSTISEDLLEDMVDAGMYCFVMPIESGNEYVLNKLINKPNKLDHIRRLAKKAKELGVYTIGYYILGLPTETKKQIQDTVDFAKELDLDYSTFTMFRPYPGTPLTELARAKGLLIEEEKGYDDYAYGEARIHSEEYDNKYLEKLRRDVWKEISEPKLRTKIGNTDIYYATIEPFVDMFYDFFKENDLLRNDK